MYPKTYVLKCKPPAPLNVILFENRGITDVTN